MISVEEALERILGEIHPLAVTQVPLAESAGQVLADRCGRARGYASFRQFGNGWLRAAQPG